ncbi:hypothetical protein LEMLEM_LOCUS7700 [Lemmus lemmus]
MQPQNTGCLSSPRASSRTARAMLRNLVLKNQNGTVMLSFPLRICGGRIAISD